MAGACLRRSFGAALMHSALVDTRSPKHCSKMTLGLLVQFRLASLLIEIRTMSVFEE